jgi:hypothetical protein
LGHIEARGLVEKTEKGILGNRDIAAVNFGGKFHEEGALELRGYFGELFRQMSVLIDGFHVSYGSSFESFSQ